MGLSLFIFNIDIHWCLMTVIVEWDQINTQASSPQAFIQQYVQWTEAIQIVRGPRLGHTLPSCTA